MLRSKRFKDIEDALRFANDFENKIIPISFVDVARDSHPINNGILLVYEPVEAPAPGTHEQDLLKECHELLSKLIDTDSIIYKNQELRAIDLKNKIDKCLSSL